MSITVTQLRKFKEQGRKFAALTAYDASFARLMDEAGIEVLLVGDSLGMVVQGQESTVPVTMDHMVYHTQLVRRGAAHALVMADMPFLSYATPEQALRNAGRLMQEGGAQMVKLECTSDDVAIVRHLTRHGVPVCVHLGLLPQTVYKLGGYKVQGRGEEAADAMVRDAQAFEQAGADVLLLESIPRSLGATITRSLGIPVIGIGAGPECDGQVLVAYDMLGITPGKRPKFSKDFLAAAGSVPAALAAYAAAVKDGSFPAPEHCFE
ncbi:MAG: 3-methyl-2-oxobutanoate hydroxymethyltransferase [Gammaproteobacteria bacterium]|nr:3-methyl-2-oxobutanoate hydroxymethyltransferase [Gammaproteobacteria bacterium]